ITTTSGNYSLVEDNIGKYLLVDTDAAALCFKIDLTSYKKIILSCRSDSKNNQFNAGIYSYLPNGALGNVANCGSCLDVSAYTGEYYVCISYTGLVRVYDIIGV
ncbi:MAG: hypothetical protein MSH20_08285, partial [Lachnospiraceae bacterium]|nr:hypothetical protein [Lachnospiraceae bacterium]